MSKNLPYYGNVTGSGQQSLNIDWGANPNRSSRSRTYSVNGGLNYLTVTQAAADALVVTGTSPINATSGLSAKQIQIGGTANGKYIQYYSELSNGVTVLSAKEYSDTQSSGSSFSTSWKQVDNFLGGTHNYAFYITLNIPANTPVGNCGRLTVYTNDKTSTAGNSKAFILNITDTAVAVDSVTVSPSSVQIDAGNDFKYYHLATSVMPSGAPQSTTWFVDSSDTSKIDVNQQGYLKGLAVITTPVKVWAKSVDYPDKKDYCEVTYAPGTITMTNASVAYNAVSATVPTSLYNIQTNSLDIRIQGTSWIHSASYDASNNQIVFLIDANSSSQQRSATISVYGTDWGNAQRYSQVVITQAGTGGAALTGLQVSGIDTIGDDGTTAHRYNLTYVPSDTTETGVTWQAIDPQGNSVEGTLVTLEKYADYCMMKVRPEGQASGATVWVQAVSNPHPQITGHKVVTVTYTRPMGNITAEPSHVNLRWNQQSDDTPVITWSGDVPSVLSVSGIIITAVLNQQTGRLLITCSSNDDPDHTGPGAVTLGGPNYSTPLTVSYTQARADNPYAHTSVNISNMAVSGNAYPTMSANVNLNNGNGMVYESFPGSFDWVLYGYESSSMVSGSQIASGTKTGYPTSVEANSTYAVVLNVTSSVPTGNMTYFKLEVEMETYTIAPAYAELGDPGSTEITG